MRFVLFASCFLTIAAPVSAQTALGANGTERTRQSGETPSATAPANGERLICRRVQSDEPSRMGGRRICRTAEQWRAADGD